MKSQSEKQPSKATKGKIRMELDWSEQSPHIRTLYAPWQSGNGCEGCMILAEEARLGVRLPDPLRTFYRAWGRRKDLTQTYQSLLTPDELVWRLDALIFCVENQGVNYWAIQRKDLGKVNPPVVKAYALPNWGMSEIASPLVWEPNYARVSDFLDTLTYQHALCGGAMHGGWTEFFHHQKFHDMWLEQNWHRRMVGLMAFGLVDEYDDDLPFYVRHGQALAWGFGCSVATCSVEDLDEIGQALQVTWEHRW
jgi:hypothetical protein